jgi:hypothetical protein
MRWMNVKNGQKKTSFTSFHNNFLLRSAAKVKIIVVTRPDEKVYVKLLGSSVAYLTHLQAENEAANVNKDMQKFTEDQLERSGSRCRGYSAADRERVEKALLAKMDGMFLWTSLKIDALDLTAPPQIEASLSKFPSELKPMYSQILSTNLPSDLSLVRKILNWVIFSVRPLKLGELNDVLGN